MKRKNYERPTMKVVQLKHKTHLLQASGTAGTQDYKWNEYNE
jgi:hypothetical protein